MNYRKKPVVIQAVQFFLAKVSDEPIKSHPGIHFDEVTNRYYVVTIHGERAHLEDGDWILPEPKPGNYYPCKPEVFADTYEPTDQRSRGTT